MTDADLVAWLERTLRPCPLLRDLQAERRKLGRAGNAAGLDEDGLRYEAWRRVQAARAKGE